MVQVVNTVPDRDPAKGKPVEVIVGMGMAIVVSG